MARTLVAVVLMLGSMGLATDVAVTSSLTFDAEAAKARPVTAVVTLLQDYLKEMEKEADTDEEVYDKMACWCDSGDKLKTKSIKDAEADITILLSKIDAGAQLSAKLQTEIQHMDAFVIKAAASLDKAITIHMKEVTEWQLEEKELLKAISALKSAIIVLSKHHSASFLQMDTGVVGMAESGAEARLATASAALRHVLKDHKDLIKGVLNPTQKRQLASFLKAPQDYFGDELLPSSERNVAELLQAKHRQPQSGEIFGILKQMLENMEKDLAEGQDEMAGNIKSFGETKASLKLEITTNEDAIKVKKAQLADINEKWQLWQMDLIDIKAQLVVDVKYLKMLKERCEMMDKEWEARQKMRAEEMESCTKALAVLNSDDAQQTFSRTFNAEFIQTRMEATVYQGLRAQASKLLRAEALVLHSPRLNALAVHVRLDAFTKVKAAINAMIVELKAQQEAEIKHKDFCIDGFHQNDMQTNKKTEEKATLDAQIEDLTITIGELTKEIAELKQSIIDMNIALKRGGEDREKEHNEFQVIVADQRATQKFLAQALAVLNKFYGSKDAKSVGFVQNSIPNEGTVINVKQTIVYQPKETEVAGPPPPGGFSTYKKKTGVIPMIQDILAEAKKLEMEAIRDEENGQKTYEDFTMETNASIEAASKSIVDKTAEKAKLEKELAEAKEALADVTLELEQLANGLADLHSSCDYILKNFDARQEARASEMDALKKALAILSGAKFDMFLQR